MKGTGRVCSFWGVCARFGAEGVCPWALRAGPGCETYPMRVPRSRWVQDAPLRFVWWPAHLFHAHAMISRSSFSPYGRRIDSGRQRCREVSHCCVAGVKKRRPWVVLVQRPGEWKTELSQARQDRESAQRPSWWKVGGDRDRSSISMWAPTAEDIIGIHSVIWPPCKDRAPLVPVVREGETRIRHWKCDAACWTQRETEPRPRRRPSRSVSTMAADEGDMWDRDGGRRTKGTMACLRVHRLPRTWCVVFNGS